MPKLPESAYTKFMKYYFSHKHVENVHTDIKSFLVNHLMLLFIILVPVYVLIQKYDPAILAGISYVIKDFYRFFLFFYLIRYFQKRRSFLLTRVGFPVYLIFLLVLGYLTIIYLDTVTYLDTVLDTVDPIVLKDMIRLALVIVLLILWTVDIRKSIKGLGL